MGPDGAGFFQSSYTTSSSASGLAGLSRSSYTTSALGLAPRALGLGPLVDLIEQPLLLLFFIILRPEWPELPSFISISVISAKSLFFR